MASRAGRERSPLLQAVAVDNSLPIDPATVELWLKDLENPLRWFVRPVFQFVLGVLLHLTWALKRLPLPQFRAHAALQRTINWFCRNFVSPEANQLILRHFAVESNILNFLRDNSDAPAVRPLELYPRTIDEMLPRTFVEHDQELFRMMRELGPSDRSQGQKSPDQLQWTHWREVDVTKQGQRRRWTQVIGDPTLAELAFNKYPHYLVGPWNLTQRFLMHGFFTEYLHARLQELRNAHGVSAR